MPKTQGRPVSSFALRTSYLAQRRRRLEAGLTRLLEARADCRRLLEALERAVARQRAALVGLDAQGIPDWPACGCAHTARREEG